MNHRRRQVPPRRLTRQGGLLALALAAALLATAAPAQENGSQEAARRTAALKDLPADAAKRLFGLETSPAPLAARSIAGFPTMESIVEERAPLHRHVDAEDVGAAAAYLLGDGGRNVTGTTLYVDSGYHAMGM